MKSKHKRSQDLAEVSIDFLTGISIFIIGLLIVISLVSGILIGLQSKTIDLDAVAYRTSVILVEDPGFWNGPNSTKTDPDTLYEKSQIAAYPWILDNASTDWENIVETNSNLKIVVRRLGLLNEINNPLILNKKKVDYFFNTYNTFKYPNDYREKLFFSDYPYHCRISLRDMNGVEIHPALGEPASSRSGYIRRVVLIKDLNPPTYSVMNLSGMEFEEVNEIKIRFSSINFENKSIGSDYWLNPEIMEFNVTLTNLTPMAISPALSPKIQGLFIQSFNGTAWNNDTTKMPITYYYDGNTGVTGPDGTITPEHLVNNISIIFPPNFFPGPEFDYRLSMIFTETQKTGIEGIDYNYGYVSSDQRLFPAILEVWVW